MSERLQKVLAGLGVASRRQVEQMISEGRVTVNGETAELGRKVVPEDVIEVDGRPVSGERKLVYLALNKPPGYVTSLRSTHGEPTVMELVDVPERLFPVGRLDKESSGLLFMTNDGDWANLVTHPRYEIQKEYRAVVRGVPDEKDLERLRNGIELPDGTVTSPGKVQRVGMVPGHAELSVTVIEGRKRQIRLMLQAIGHPVIRLERVRIGPLRLGALPRGEGRWLEGREVESIREQARKAEGRGPRAEAAGGDRRAGRGG